VTSLPRPARDHLEIIRHEGARFIAVVTSTDLELPVPSCPGWDLRALAVHMGEIHRWARLAAVTAAVPDESLIDVPAAGASAEDIGAWLRTGLDALVDDLGRIPGDGPTWHPFTVPQVAAVWPRRQAHELTIHRWDAEHATDMPTTIDPDQAVDHVAEYLEVIVPRVMTRDARVAPVGVLRIELLGAGGGPSTLLRVRSDGLTLEHLPEHDDVADDGIIVGRPSDVLLALWGRAPLPGSATVSGDVTAGWLRYGGN
jgi:uncharacterized protein (TIGR03083 family)